jgi:hypothetical protein
MWVGDFPPQSKTLMNLWKKTFGDFMITAGVGKCGALAKDDTFSKQSEWSCNIHPKGPNL